MIEEIVDKLWWMIPNANENDREKINALLTKHEAAVLEREAKWCEEQKLPEVAEVPALYYPNNMKLVTVNKERNAAFQSTADHLRKQQN